MTLGVAEFRLASQRPKVAKKAMLNCACETSENREKGSGKKSTPSLSYEGVSICGLPPEMRSHLTGGQIYFQPFLSGRGGYWRILADRGGQWRIGPLPLQSSSKTR